MDSPFVLKEVKRMLPVMKYLTALILILSGSLNGLAIEKADLENAHTKRSYALGAKYGQSLKQLSLEIDIDTFVEGLRHGLAASSLLADTEISAILEQISSDARAANQRKKAELVESNRKAGQAFLKANADKEGVVTLASGLQYKVIKEGTGPKPKATDLVEVHYRGTLIDGQEFDSSFKRGKPASFGVSNVIKGWTEALQLMNVGSKWKLFIPSELAYGSRGTGPMIGPNATLIFEVELLNIKAPPPLPTGITSDIIRVPSKQEIEEGAEVEVIKAEDIEDYKEKEAKRRKTEQESEAK